MPKEEKGGSEMKKMKKMLAAVLTGGMILSLAACGSGGEDSGESKGEKKDSDIKVGFVVSDMSDAFFAHLVQELQDYSEEIGVTFTVTEAPEIGDKITGIENFVEAKCDTIICHVTDSDALKDAALGAEEAGVNFISYDSDIEGTSGFIGVDNMKYGYEIGKNAADWIKENFKESDEVKVGVCNYPDYPFLVTREEGILKALEELAPNAKVVVSAKAGYTPEGVDVGDAWVQSNPDLNVVVGINDAGVLGVYETFNAAGINGDKLGMFGGDAVDDALAALKEGGTFRGTVSTEMLPNAHQFIDMAVELAEKGKVEERELYLVVICNGQTRRIFYKNEISRYRVLECLTGKSTLKSIKKKKIEDSQIVFRAENITNHYFKKMSFYCKKGEILGIYDMRNKFSREWYRLLLGKRIYDGEIYVGEKKVRLGEEYHLVRNKMGIIDGDTYQSLLFPELSLLENLGIAIYQKTAKLGWFINSRVRKYLERKGNEISENNTIMKDVKGVSRSDAMQIVYQRWALVNPEVLFCFQPFLRLDAITRAQVESILLDYSLTGMSIVINSANIEDILAICDRVLVVEDNRIQQEVERRRFSEVFQ